MKVKIQGAILLLLGIVGAIFVFTYDILAGKPVNDISGPKSIAVLIICAVLIVMGVRFLLKRPQK